MVCRAAGARSSHCSALLCSLPPFLPRLISCPGAGRARWPSQRCVRHAPFLFFHTRRIAENGRGFFLAVVIGRGRRHLGRRGRAARKRGRRVGSPDGDGFCDLFALFLTPSGHRFQEVASAAGGLAGRRCCGGWCPTRPRTPPAPAGAGTPGPASALGAAPRSSPCRASSSGSPPSAQRPTRSRPGARRRHWTPRRCCSGRRARRG